MALVKFQMGKNGLTDAFIQALKGSEKTHKVIKIALLPTSTRDKEEMKKMAAEIISKLETSEHGYNHKIIGFTLVLLRYKKNNKMAVKAPVKKVKVQE